MILPTPELLSAILTFSAEKQNNPYTLGTHYDGGRIKVNEFIILNIDKTLTFNRLTLALGHKHHIPEQPDVIMNISINIHELAHKCKEWAWEKGHSLCTTPLMANDSIIYCWDELERSKDETISIKAHSVPEAIFKACEWILANKE